MPFLFAKQKILTRSHWGNKLLAGVHLSNKAPTIHPKKSKSRQPCQVSESPELTRVVRQFIEANRAPWQAEKDFGHFLRGVLGLRGLLRIVARKRIVPKVNSGEGCQPCTTLRGSGIDFPLHRCGLLGFEVFLSHGLCLHN